MNHDQPWYEGIAKTAFAASLFPYMRHRELPYPFLCVVDHPALRMSFRSGGSVLCLKSVESRYPMDCRI